MKDQLPSESKERTSARVPHSCPTRSAAGAAAVEPTENEPQRSAVFRHSRGTSPRPPYVAATLHGQHPAIDTWGLVFHW